MTTSAAAAAPSFSENRRQLVHVAMVGWAFLLRVLTWQQAAALAAAAFAFNAFVLPRAGGRSLYRPADVERGTPLGILFYPLSVLVLILAFRARLDLAAAAWAILAAGDGAATLAGRRFKGRSLPWNRDKTWAGTAAFVLCGSAAGVLLCWWTLPNVPVPPPLLFVLTAPVIAAAAAAAVESIPVRLDDNLSVPFTAGAALWLLSLVDADAVQSSMPLVLSRLAPALAVNVVFAALAFAARTVSASGAVAGAVIGAGVYLGAGAAGWSMLLAALVAAAGTSKIGWRRKAELGIAQEREGRRGAGNALANCAAGACGAAVAVVSPHAEAGLLALVAGLAAGASDTVASEIGKAWGRRTYLVVGFRRVPPGTSGAISLEGTAANVAAAAALAALGAAVALIPWAAMPAVIAGALAGSAAESVLGATLEGPGVLNNDLLNFINTLVAIVVALAVWNL